ncbi:MAG: NirD/YgiW/YdeI family stress tolerance protein [Gammaproteobacteria bacterium]|jgi:uncharacterized protein (TIGR00156 family)|uniref:YgiW/YdeI family stress tolerance OB fold protein n=1 Tax=Methyloprofundus sp. TaxID=2020875 RepID=UPI0017D744FB|nr:NirD/YgiW/YdeI family stress tolerance protein [Methyloprofundus sp.]MBT3811915.1 NirD/YgiW/YdeI family stress tolerance protein [Gammaproteobacteria bacterium]HIL79026.1 NirD/YgiW/YdeI family stress tolerance protein [Methylococcales bacterium]MBT4146307.1 NirD/YgiW/YdeI family stress tolerance protein [Gammaproteobacteria bacterium]MBT5223076.1 NirD/YgiW/YdeI family stress tolerance protein [Gammaproteobacteria bacterium]MBT5826263.1 NirD/YgiW/YdeI family stress tolerance protein [Gammapr
MYIKLAILTMILVFSAISFAGFEGPGTTLSAVPVNSINDLDDDDEVILEGYLVKKTGKEEYLFKDKTGEIKVEIDDKKLRGITITPETLIKIKGEVDNDWFSIQIDVDSVEIIKQ